MNIYIAGKITGLDEEVYSKAFQEAEDLIKLMGHTPINPIKIVPKNLDYNNQMNICFSLIDISEAVMMLDNWVDSPGATNELVYAAKLEKKIIYYDEQKALYGSIDPPDYSRDALHWFLKGLDKSKTNTANGIWVTSTPSDYDLFKHQMRNCIIFP